MIRAPARGIVIGAKSRLARAKQYLSRIPIVDREALEEQISNMNSIRSLDDNAGWGVFKGELQRSRDSLVNQLLYHDLTDVQLREARGKAAALDAALSAPDTYIEKGEEALEQLRDLKGE